MKHAPPAERARGTVSVPRQATRDRRPPPQVRPAPPAVVWPPDPAGGAHWRLHTTSTGVVVLGAGSRVAEAHISVQRDVTVIELWSDMAAAPSPLRKRLVDQVFAHPAVRPHRAVLVCVPRGDTTMITEVLRRLPRSNRRPVGATCLIEGRV